MEPTDEAASFSWLQTTVAVVLGSPIAAFLMIAVDKRGPLFLRIVIGALPAMAYLAAIAFLPDVPGLIGFVIASFTALLMKYLLDSSGEKAASRPWWQAILATFSGVIVVMCAYLAIDWLGA